MQYTVDGLKKDIRIAMDENAVSEQLISTGDIDTLTLDEIIESKLEDAVRTIERDAPGYMLDGGLPFTATVEWKSAIGYGGGTVRLPADFLRLVSFQMSDWARAVTVPIAEDNPLYAIQTSRYPGIRGCPQKPVVAITSQDTGPVLEFYSCTAGSTVFVKRARYIPIPKISDGNISICEKLYRAAVYSAAYLVALSIGAPKLAESMLAIRNDLMK